MENGPAWLLRLNRKRALAETDWPLTLKYWVDGKEHEVKRDTQDEIREFLLEHPDFDRMQFQWDLEPLKPDTPMAVNFCRGYMPVASVSGFGPYRTEED